MNPACPAGNDATQEVRPSSRTVVALSARPQPMDVLEALMAEGCDNDAVFIGYLACGYSCIKQLVPDLVIVVMESDDEAAFATCELLSMLKVDRETRHIRVVTWVTGRPSPQNEIETIEELIVFSQAMN